MCGRMHVTLTMQSLAHLRDIALYTFPKSNVRFVKTGGLRANTGLDGEMITVCDLCSIGLPQYCGFSRIVYEV